MSAIALMIGSAIAGCGVISPDVTSFDLNLTLPGNDQKFFTISSEGWQVSQPAADSFLTMSCGPQLNACPSAVEEICPMGCTGSCNQDRDPPACDLSLDISLSQSINLMMEQPELKSLSDQSEIKVAIDGVTYEVVTNNLNIDTPELTVYAAPSNVLSPADNSSDDGPIPIGTIEPIPAGEMATGPQPITFTATGKAQLVSFLSKFKTPFNIIIGSSIVVTAGQPVPKGKLDALVHIVGHAGL